MFYVNIEYTRYYIKYYKQPNLGMSFFMILYQLKCHREHKFDAWFLNSATYDSQLATANITCPHCGTTDVGKAPMAPNISRRRKVSSGLKENEYRANQVAKKILEAVDGLHDEVKEKCDYVGDEFAEAGTAARGSVGRSRGRRGCVQELKDRGNNEK